MKTIVTDRGYAWVVLFAAFVSNIVTTGTYSATGVLFVEYLEYYDQSRSITSIITAVFGATRGLAGLVAGGLIHKYGSRPVGMVGALFGTLGYGLSAFAPSVYYLCVTQGVLLGLTFSVENPLAVDLLGLENLPKTFGFCSLVSAVGFLVLVPGMGWVADMTGSFAIPFACEGIMHTLFAASFVIFVPLLQRR